jgi:subtilisin-like proprotein convertase family protein
MACSTIDTSSLPAGQIVSDVDVEIAMSHTFVGDLTIKLVSPAGSVLGLTSRPGVAETADNGNDTAGFGENSNLVSANPLTYSDIATTSAEQMGKVPIDLATGQTICVDGGTPCLYMPAPGTVAGLTNFAGFDYQNPVGNWQLCFGDSAGADTGTLASWTLTLTTDPQPTAADVTVSGRVVNASGRGIAGVSLTLRDAEGNRLTATTNTFGFYRFENVPAGQTYVLTALSRQYRFTQQVLAVEDNLEGVDFIAER